MNIKDQVAIVTGDGRGGQTAEVVVPVVLFLAARHPPLVTGEVTKAQDWNADQRDL